MLSLWPQPHPSPTQSLGNLSSVLHLHLLLFQECYKYETMLQFVLCEYREYNL